MVSDLYDDRFVMGPALRRHEVCIGILRCVGAASFRRHHHSPASAMQPAGQDPKARLVPGTVTLPLRSQTNASPFWIMLLLVWGQTG